MPSDGCHVNILARLKMMLSTSVVPNYDEQRKQITGYVVTNILGMTIHCLDVDVALGDDRRPSQAAGSCSTAIRQGRVQLYRRQPGLGLGDRQQPLFGHDAG